MEDFNINELVAETLKPLPVPVYFSARKEVQPPFVLFVINDERGTAFWDDEEQEITYKVTVNIFTTGNYIELKNQIVKLMREAGFYRDSIPQVLYQEDIGVYNQPMFFSYYREL